MKQNPATKAIGLVDGLIASFANALRRSEGEARPVALLWTDGDSQWRELIPSLQIAVPHLYTLGPYDASMRRGPAIWLKCIVDRTIPEASPPQDIAPILYLPGVTRQELRAGDDCRAAFQPLIELQYRGRDWHQQNGRDWSVEAFLVSEDGLGLDIAHDLKTREAMIRSLSLLAEAPVESLRGRRLDADDFDKLAVTDSVRDLLHWMSDAEGFRRKLDAARWESFRNICRSEFNLDPDEDLPAAAAAFLVNGGGRWDDVWRRFCEAPRIYPGVSNLLRDPAPGQAKLAFDQPRSPVANENFEAQLRRDLEGVAVLPHRDACERVLTLEAQHSRRREWVWAQLDESPLAVALEPLSRLASLARSSPGGASVESMATTYASGGWRCDAAAIETIARTKGATETALISRVVRALYEPWLDGSARRFQELVSELGGEFTRLARGVESQNETCLMFVDGLRYDIGALLFDRLTTRGFKAQLSYRISPVPTVTATSKPMATPAHDAMAGVDAPEDFMPVLSTTRQPATAARLRDELARRNVEVLEPDELRIPAGTEAGGWTEIGRLDDYGHKLGMGLVSHIDGELESIISRVVALLESGWSRIRIVTDHGWLLLPGGLPKVELPRFLVATKWARCALVVGDSSVSVPTYSWHWNAHTRIASPPGIGCFNVGNEYAHGGVSLQESVVPEIVIERGVRAVKAEILTVQWRGMRCRVSVQTDAPSLLVDLRLNWRQANTSIAAAVKEVTSTGEASLIVEEDKYEGAAATLVLLSSAGDVLDRKATTVGEES